jgi:hypothetical protein
MQPRLPATRLRQVLLFLGRLGPSQACTQPACAFRLLCALLHGFAARMTLVLMCQRAAQLILRSAISRAAQPLLEVTRAVELLHLILSTLFGKPPPPVPGLFSDSSGTFMSTFIFLLGVYLVDLYIRLLRRKLWFRINL